MPIQLPKLMFLLIFVLAISACDSKQIPAERSDQKPALEQATAATPIISPTTEMTTPVGTFELETAVKPTDTLETLRKQYGQTNVIEGELPGAEGETAQGWIIYPNKPEMKLMIYTDESNSHPGSLLVDEANSKWHLANSVKIGTNSKTLESLNKKPFSFYGFYWDYGGVITDWNGGDLDKKAAGALHINIHLCPPEDPTLPDNYLSGDGTFNSDNPLAQKYPPLVCKLGVYFPSEEKSE